MSADRNDEVSSLPFLSHLNVVAAWRADVERARADLEATPAQAFVLAAHAFAWRVAPVTLLVALTVAGAFVARGDARPSELLFAAVVGLFGPQMAAFLLTFPVAWFAMLQTWYRGSRDAQIRFGTTGLVYPYYGWRYAYRDRRRPWGAMTREERILANPKRAGVHAPEGPGAHARSK
jgi:hypothetical protein